MTPEQESELFESLGGMKVMMRDVKDGVQLLKEVLNGNGHPEEGMVYRLSQVEHTQANCPIKEVAVNVQDIKTQLEVAKASESTLTKLWTWIKAHPKISGAIGLAILGSMGFSVDKLINLLNLVKEIALKVGVSQ